MAMQLGEGTERQRGNAPHAAMRGTVSWGTKSAKAQQSQLGKVKEITHWTLKMANAKQDLVIDMQSVSNLIAVWKRSRTSTSQKHGCWLLNEWLP